MKSAWLALVVALTLSAGAQAPPDKQVLKLNGDMRVLYDSALKNAQSDLLSEHPVILALFSGQGGTLILYRPGQPPLVAERVPVRYELIKSVSHSSMAVFAFAYANLGLPAESWRGPMQAYRDTSQRALEAVERADLPADWKQTQRNILQRNLAMMDKALSSGGCSEEDLHRYATELKPFLQLNITWAADTQVEHWMQVLQEWKEMLGSDWEKTYGAANTLYVTRQNNILYSVLAQFFGQNALNSRLFLFETSAFTTEPEQMLTLLARIVGDRQVGEAFFGDYYLMDNELMGGDARRAIEREDKRRGIQVVLPPLTPFHSNEWPFHHDPTAGQGPGLLEDVK